MLFVRLLKYILVPFVIIHIFANHLLRTGNLKGLGVLLGSGVVFLFGPLLWHPRPAARLFAACSIAMFLYGYFVYIENVSNAIDAALQEEVTRGNVSTS